MKIKKQIQILITLVDNHIDHFNQNIRKIVINQIEVRKLNKLILKYNQNQN